MRFVLTVTVALVATTFAEEHNHGDGHWTSARPDGHAPIGVMAEHTHGTGEWMVSYRYMRMEMEGNRSGTDDLSVQDVRAQGFAAIPVEMTMDMHMFGVMYAPTDKLTLMGMLPYAAISMNHVAGPTFNVRFKTESEGFGDLKLTSLYTIADWGRNHIHLNGGVSFPTGDIDEKDVTPASGGVAVRLPYPMQIGSGTFDLLPGITYLGQAERISWGAQARGDVHLGENDNDYTLGDSYAFTGWGSCRLVRWASASARLEWMSWGNVRGTDPALNPNLVPTADPNRRGGDRLDALFGFNLKRGGHRLAFEFGLPVMQDLDGPQLETDYMFLVGWQYAW